MDNIKLLIDKVNQGLIRVTNARNELYFCEHLIREKETKSVNHIKINAV